MAGGKRVDFRMLFRAVDAGGIEGEFPRGGIVVAVQRELGVPVKLVGLGEGPDDLAPFDPIEFVEALVGDS